MLTVLLLFCMFFAAGTVFAAATDEILDFTITVDVNDDASLTMIYHIDWKVLDDSIGELEWIDLGVPNGSHWDIKPLSNTINYIDDYGSELYIYLDRPYGENETVSIDFSMTQDYMYQIDKWVEGETVYTFTPAWFAGIDVDSLTVRWNAEKTGAWQPDCVQEDGRLVFTTSLSAGDRYTLSVVYPNDAFGFDIDHQESEIIFDDYESYENYGYYGYERDNGFDVFDTIGGLTGLVFLITIIAIVISWIRKFVNWISEGTGFGSDNATEKKIVRTKIEYYGTCPSCGGTREEGKDVCAYCGRDMIKSKEVVEESEIEKPENYTKNGTYHYGSSPDTFLRVNVINVPVSRPHSSGGSSGRSSGGSSHHSSCASSCACASHCACASSCACACACASSGRAGCSVKDFFHESVHKNRIRVASKR